MPVFIGDVLESCGGPILDLGGNKVKGFGVFADGGSRNDLDTEFRASGYLSVVAGDLEVYSGSTWDNANSWTKIASEFSLYPHIEVDGVDNAPNRAAAFVSDTADDGDRYSFGIYDTTSDLFRKISGDDLKSIIIHYFGQELAFYLSETTGNSIDYYSDTTNGLVGDTDGDGLVTVSDILNLLGNFGGTLEGMAYRDYVIKLGESLFPGANAEPLVGTAGGSVGAGNVLDETFGLDGFGNNVVITGNTAGDDIIVSSATEPSITIEHKDANNNYIDLNPFLVSNNGEPAITNLFDGQGNPTQSVTSSIRFNSNESISVASATTVSGANTTIPVTLNFRISLYENQGDTIIPTTNGDNYIEVQVGVLVQPPLGNAGTFFLNAGDIYSGNLIQDILDNYSIVLGQQTVHQIKLTPIVQNNGFVIPLVGPASGICDSFEIDGLKIIVKGGNALG